jgi:hypothetical protein
MEDELWFAYLDQVARQEKQAVADAAEPAKPDKPATPSPFRCEELPSE